MLTNKSIDHVKQGVGLVYSFDCIKGYYNDLTKKITKDKKNYKSTNVITISTETKSNIFFPIAIFQYGLGSYDLYLLNKDADLMKTKFLSHLNWAYENQNNDGSWNNFDFIYPDYPFSAMAQGEGASLLIRGFVETKNIKYLAAAKKAIDFMLVPISKGGTAEYFDGDLILYEFTCFPYVYNGWIFAIFGLIDYVIATNDKEYKDITIRAIESLSNRINEMDVGYWSRYRKDDLIASPFYHNLHIAQLEILSKYTGNTIYKFLIKKFNNYKHNPFKRVKAFFIKVKQKLKE